MHTCTHNVRLNLYASKGVRTLTHNHIDTAIATATAIVSYQLLITLLLLFMPHSITNQLYSTLAAKRVLLQYRLDQAAFDWVLGEVSHSLFLIHVQLLVCST
jgi:RNA polymerase Rpb1, domain 6